MYHVSAPRRRRRARSRARRNPTGFPFTGKYYRPKFKTSKTRPSRVRAKSVWQGRQLLATVLRGGRVKAANPRRLRRRKRNPVSRSVALAMRAAMGRGRLPSRRRRVRYPKSLRGVMKQLRALGISAGGRRRVVRGYKKKRAKRRAARRGRSYSRSLKRVSDWARATGQYAPGFGMNPRRSRRRKSRRFALSLNPRRRRKQRRRNNPGGGFSLRRIPIVGGLTAKLGVGGFSIDKAVKLGAGAVGVGAGLSASLLGPDKIAQLTRMPQWARGWRGAVTAGVSTGVASMGIALIAKLAPKAGGVRSLANIAAGTVALGGAFGVLLRLLGLWKPEIVSDYLPVSKAAQGRTISVAPAGAGAPGKGAAGMGMMTMEELAAPGLNDYIDFGGMSGMGDYFPDGATVPFDSASVGSETF